MRYLYESPSLGGKLSRWLILLSEFDIKFLTKKVIKGRVVAEFLAQQAITDDEPWDLEFPDENLGALGIQGWTMHFDGAVNKLGAGIGVIITTPEGEMMPFSKKLMFPVTNNMAEYEACLYEICYSSYESICLQQFPFEASSCCRGLKMLLQKYELHMCFHHIDSYASDRVVLL